MQFAAGTAIVSGVLVLLGWFILPVRIMLLVVVIALVYRWCRARNWSWRSWPTRQILGVIAAGIAVVLILATSGTTESIRSPWSVVPAPFFLLFALIAMWSVSAALFLASLVAILIFPIGFGFDHFIHAAAERIIAVTGSLSPPPLFYSGHYGLAILLGDLLPGVDVALADRLLVPLLTLTLVPLAYRALRTVLTERAALLGMISLLIVPFLTLSVSTPQATANVFALATVFSLMLISPPLVEGEREGVRPQTHGGGVRRWMTPLATALAALLAQPMTGIITIAIVAMAFAWQRGWRIVGATIAALGAAGIPLAFSIASRVIPQIDVAVAFQPLAALQRFIGALRDALTFAAADFATADALTVARVLLPIAWVVIAIVGARRARVGAVTLIIAPLMALIAAALVAATVTIPTQLGEEQSQFPLRLVQLAALLAVPLAGVGLGHVLERIRGRLPTLAMSVTLGVVATMTLLLAYPRDDAQARSGLWSVSASDIAAVHAIASDSGDTPYVVLANQMLGAAAIKEFGFQPSFIRCTHPPTPPLPEGSGETKNFSPSTAVEGEREGVGQPCTETLAFPLPAGGPIARKYWEYVSAETLSRAPIDAAMDLVGAERAYVVLHDYWRNYERTAAATAAMAERELSPIPHLRIFRFD
ncbi:MAG: hypothetical protein Q7S02_00130 [bacterium]|nr:hypothetical protein [bacterium]